MLDGDFAFVVVDGDNYMARDHWGLKPLYGLGRRGGFISLQKWNLLQIKCKTFSISSRTFYTGK
jgi:asparagine synthase (glutamine-hydrolysing)